MTISRTAPPALNLPSIDHSFQGWGYTGSFSHSHPNNHQNPTEEQLFCNKLDEKSRQIYSSMRDFNLQAKYRSLCEAYPHLIEYLSFNIPFEDLEEYKEIQLNEDHRSILNKIKEIDLKNHYVKFVLSKNEMGFLWLC